MNADIFSVWWREETTGNTSALAGLGERVIAE